MFLKKFVNKIFKKNKETNLNQIKKKCSKIEGPEEIETITIQKRDYELLIYCTLTLEDLIDDYFFNAFSLRTTNASSYLSTTEDLISPDKLKANITIEDFEYIKVIGKGYFGKVSQVKYLKDGSIFALKSLKKNKLKEAKHIQHTKTERKILEFVQHPFIVSLKFAFQTETKLYLVMDYYNGGELFYHLRQKNRFDEEQAKFYLAQIILAIEFLHKNKIIYRDLKPENIILDNNGYVKLTDFGLAKDDIQDEEGTQTFCGTPEYLAPEIIGGEKYGKSVDVWCMGILLYEMIFGLPPFYDKNKNKLYKKIIFNQPDVNKFTKLNVSNDAKDLLLKLLDKNQKNRIKIIEIKAHPFYFGFDFEKLYKYEINAPFKPNLSGNNDYKYIDPLLSAERAEDSVYNGCSPLAEKRIFEDFTYAESGFLRK